MTEELQKIEYNSISSSHKVKPLTVNTNPLHITCYCLLVLMEIRLIVNVREAEEKLMHLTKSS